MAASKSFPHTVTLACALLGSALAVPVAQAQASFPEKPVRLIVSSSPGGITDLLARAAATQAGATLGQTVVVENRPGAGTLIGMSACAKAPPDGYTICITDNQSLVYNPLLFKKLPYDADRDFAPVTALAKSYGGAIVASASLPDKDFKSMVEDARKRPGAINFGTWGPGSVPAIYFSWIVRENKIDLTGIPYKGSAPSLLAVTSGEVQLAYSNWGLAKPMVETGKLKVLAITGSKRHPDIPNVPSLAELDSDPDMDTFWGIYAPAGTPSAAVHKLAKAFGDAMRSPAMATLTKENSLAVIGNTPEDFATMLKAARANAAKVFTAIGIEPTEAPAW
jgi:tripartite-type tricarboxylate transporter receptor subunit TctC